MTAPRDRKAARRRYTDAKVETARARQALAESGPDGRDDLESRHGGAVAAEQAAWDAYLAAIYDATELS